MNKIRIVYFISVEQELSEILCLFKKYLNNPKYLNYLFYEEGHRIESQLAKNKAFFNKTCCLKSVNFSKKLFNTVKNYFNNKRILKEYEDIDFIVSINNNTITFCQLYNSFKKAKLILFKTIHPSYFYTNYFLSLYYSFFSLLFSRIFMIYRKHYRKGRIFNLPFPLIKADYVLTTNKKIYLKEKKFIKQAFLIKHPLLNIFKKNSDDFSPLVIVDSEYSKTDKNYLRDIKNKVLRESISNPIIYIKDHPTSTINDSLNLKKVFHKNFEILDNRINGIDLLKSFKFSPVISAAPSTLSYYSRLFGIETIDIIEDLNFSNDEVLSYIKEMNETIIDEGEDSELILDKIIS